MYARDFRHLERAKRAALTSKYRWRHGAIVANGNRVISTGINKARNATWASNYGNITIHAEVAAIKGRNRLAR